MLNIQKIILPSNYLYYMKLGVNDLKMMIAECVRRILEYHHVIDPSLESLAEMILSIVEKGGGVIPANEVTKFNPYFGGVDLNVAIENGTGDVASYEHKTNTLYVSNSSSFYRNGRLKEAIMHELSHYVDKNLRTKPDFANKKYSDDTDVAKLANDILYYFSPTEMQARLTQYKYFLEKYPFYARKPLTFKEAENVLHLEYMQDLIEEIENEEFENSYFGIVHRIAYQESVKRTQRRGGGIPGFLFGFKDENEYNSQKSKLISRLAKKLSLFSQKAGKIKFDASSN